MSRIPPDAFDYYFALGANRSYQAVADKYGVSKTAIVNRAVSEGWQERVERLEAKARERADEKAVESVEQMNTRHLKAAKIVQAKALETLRSVSLTSAMDAVRALDLGIKQERLARGEPSERNALTIEDTIRREYERWLDADDDEEDWETDDDEHDEDAETPE